jgi:molybdopterin converting factor small subunit
VRIELYGIARARAGTAAVDVDATTGRDARRALARACPGAVPDVLDENGRLAEGFVLSLDGSRFLGPADEPLPAGSTLLILGAQSGG